MHYIVVFANDLNPDGSLGKGTKDRCREAAKRYQELFIKGQGCKLVFAAGCGGRVPQLEMMSAMMLRYTAKTMSGSAFPHITNLYQEKIWGIVKELGWLIPYIDPSDTVEAVISRQAAWRVWLIGWCFYQRRVDIVYCQTSTPWWHEILAAAKLLAYAVGLGAPVEWFRRRYYREW